MRATPGAAARVAHLPHVAEVTQDVSVSAQSDSYDPAADAGSAYNVAKSLDVDDAWSKGARGAGTTVALIDTGISPVGSLATTKVVNGPDLSFDSQSDSTRYLDLNGARLASWAASSRPTRQRRQLFGHGPRHPPAQHQGR